MPNLPMILTTNDFDRAISLARDRGEDPDGNPDRLQPIMMAVPALALLPFVEHGDRCAWLQVQWNHGSCDCGLHALPQELRAAMRKIKPDIFKMPHEEK